MIIVVTGGMGCGKTTLVKQMVTDFVPSFTVVDYDQLVTDMYQDETIKQKLYDQFGTFLKSDISEIVFTNRGSMAHLHLIVDTYLFDQINAINPTSNVILDMPLWFEYEHKFTIKPDLIICAMCKPELQFDRVKQRDGKSDEHIRSMLAYQMTPEYKASRSDIVIHTDDPSTVTYQLSKALLQVTGRGDTTQ